MMGVMNDNRLSCIQHGVWTEDYCGPECARLTRLYYEDTDLKLIEVEENPWTELYGGADRDDAVESLPLRKQRMMETVHLPPLPTTEEGTAVTTTEDQHWLIMVGQGALAMVVHGEGEEPYALPRDCPPIEGEFIGGYNGQMRVAKANDILKHIAAYDAKADAQ